MTGPFSSSIRRFARTGNANFFGNFRNASNRTSIARNRLENALSHTPPASNYSNVLTPVRRFTSSGDSNPSDTSNPLITFNKKKGKQKGVVTQSQSKIPDQKGVQKSKLDSLLEITGTTQNELFGHLEELDPAQLEREKELISKVVLDSFPKKMEHIIFRKMIDFAKQCAGKNPRDRRDHMEYYKVSLYKEVNDIRSKNLNLSNDKLYAQAIEGLNPSPELEKDRARANELRRGPVKIDKADFSDQKVMKEILRAHSRWVGFTSPDAGVVHARKHQGDLPPDRQSAGDPIQAYYECLRKTLDEGEIVNVKQVEDRTMVEVQHKYQYGTKTIGLRAILYINSDPRMTVATFGRIA